MIQFNKKVEYIVSNKTEILTNKVNKRVEELENEYDANHITIEIDPVSIAYTYNGKSLVYILATSIRYTIYKEEK